MAKNKPSQNTYRKIYDILQAPVSSKHDCGRICAPLNGGEPICCSTENAIPVVDKDEWTLLKHRTKMWKIFKPFDAASRKIVDDLATTCRAIECNGARNCERDNRTLACRSFPFFPYMSKDGFIIGVSYYWGFEDQCWVISNLDKVDIEYVAEMVRAHEILFEEDPDELETFMDHSADMRRVFSRWDRAIPVITADGRYLKVLPHGEGVERAGADDFEAFGPYVSEETYAKAVAEAEAEEAKKQKKEAGGNAMRKR